MTHRLELTGTKADMERMLQGNGPKRYVRFALLKSEGDGLWDVEREGLVFHTKERNECVKKEDIPNG